MQQHKHNQTNCGYCGNTDAKNRCSRCNNMYYCNKQCQVKHWNRHKLKCTLIAHENNTSDAPYIQRIENLLTKYHQNLVSNTKHNIYELILKYYQSESIDQFVSDYGKYVTNVDNNSLSQKYNNICDIKSCGYIARQYRNRDIYDCNSIKRYKLYHNCDSEKCAVIYQLLDILHNVKYHLIDQGLRYDTNVNDNSKNEKLHHLKQHLLQKRLKFNKITNKQKNDEVNRFVTNMSMTETNDQETDNKDDQETKTYLNLKPNYSFGYRFYYHKWYKENASKKDAALPFFKDGPQTFFETANNANYSDLKYTIGDWYIEPKYDNMRQEVLNNKQAPLTMIEFNNTFLKTSIKYNAFKQNVETHIIYWQRLYGMDLFAPVTMKHILALLLYTNNTKLCTEFSKSFRKIKKNETDEQLKQRHCEFANWGKYLRELIEVYGTRLDETKIKSFYHGISTKMMFTGLSQHFCTPTSTTLIYNTAVMFAAPNGMVITIQNNYAANSFFSCIQWSDFPGESEMLFIGGYQRLKIFGLSMLDENCNYDKWIQCVNIFERSIGGMLSSHVVTWEHYARLRVLISQFVNDDNYNKGKVESPPIYVSNLFKNFCDSQYSVQIDIDQYNRQILHDDINDNACFGHFALKDLYFHSNGYIKLDMFRKLLKNSVGLMINCKNKISGEWNGYKYSSSITIDDEYLLYMLKHLNNKTVKSWPHIVIDKPNNSSSSLKHLIKKFSNLFGACNYELEIQKTNHNQFGKCDSFRIDHMHCDCKSDAL
eukprot:200831_1